MESLSITELFFGNSSHPSMDIQPFALDIFEGLLKYYTAFFQ